MSFVDNAVSLIGDAAAPYALITYAGRSIGGIVPDVTIREVVSDENAVTQHPVETGSSVANHIYSAPVAVEMYVGWSDSGGNYTGYSEDTYQLLLALKASRQPFDVYTGKRMFSSMVFRNIEQEIDETNENALFLRVRLEQVVISGASAGGDGVTASNQAFPGQTGPEAPQGTVTPQPYSGPLPTFVQNAGLFGG